MATLVQVGLDGGGSLLLESAETITAGPVKVGRAADAVQDLQDSLRTLLRPVAQASREVLTELRSADPDEVKVEFGVKLTVGAGAVVAKAEAACHFKITLTWSRDDSGGPGPDEDLP